MYAFISNEYRTIVYTQRQLDFLISIYSYPQFKKVNSEYEAKQWFVEKDRSFIRNTKVRYGRKDKVSYISVEHFIANENIYYNIDTSKFGLIKFEEIPRNAVQDVRFDLIKLKLKNVVLDDTLIAHHCIAISNILKILGPYPNVELILPDISVYLACTKYTGKNFVIQKTKREINDRYGDTYYVIK